VSHPKVVDQALISKMLALPAEKVQCILSGSAHCTYVVQTVAKLETMTSEANEKTLRPVEHPRLHPELSTGEPWEAIDPKSA
jgi:hypothetical protein